jgi:Ca2+-transporting ATPase
MSAGDEASSPPGGEDKPHVFAGTLVVAGRGTLTVTQTGARAEIGRIGAALSEMDRVRTALQREVDTLVRRLAVFGVGVSVLVAVGYGVTRGEPIAGLLAGISTAMALLPEELPVVLTVFLALGAWRLSQHHVLTRQMAAIEALGAATVLCTDKTGTLTANKMRITRLIAEGETVVVGEQPLPEAVHLTVEMGILASQADPFDPMEVAFHELGRRMLDGTEHLHEGWVIEREYPLSPELLAISHVYRSPDGKSWMVAAKGAPEAIIDLCHLDDDQARAVADDVARLARDGLRVLGVATARVDINAALPEHSHAFSFAWVGLVGLEDPVRADVPAAVAAAARAGIRVVMITGDYPVTASAIARAAGLPGADRVITGAQLASMSDLELAGRLRSATVFARMVPAQKLRLVQALSASGEVVAMTGDGVNDAPALKAAQIGIAMGRRGTDVAREAADLVLLEDDFDSIVKTVRLGRRIYDNIENATGYLIAVHVPTAGMAVLPLLAGWPMMFFPVHIVFIEFVIDPACSIAFEAEGEAGGVMKRPPRLPSRRLFDRQSLGIAIVQGLAVLAATAGVYGAGLALAYDAEAARAAAFACIVFGNLGLILCNRSRTESILRTWRRPNRAMGWVFAGTLAGLAIVLTVPAMQRLFQFAPIGVVEVLAAFTAATAAVVLSEVVKLGVPGRRVARP